MNPKLNQPWISLARIEELVTLEPVLFLAGLIALSLITYKVFLRGVSWERHRNLRRLYWNLFGHFGLLAFFFGSYVLLQRSGEMGWAWSSSRAQSYFGLAALIWGAVVFVKLSRILMFEYLFLGHMREGVPVLIVNLTALLLSVGIGGWILNEVFGVRLAPLLATSAIFSLVLGLALQDTLGNLFAGIALQLDKPFEIGDWVEVTSNGAKWLGRVEEISWRATLLIGLSDEHIVLSNRAIAQAEIANFTRSGKPVYRSQIIKIPHGSPLQEVSEVLLAAVKKVPGVLQDPHPLVLMVEANESWLAYRVSYAMEDFGLQWTINHQVIGSIVSSLEKAGMGIAAQRIFISKGAYGT